MDYIMKQVHEVQLEMALEVKRICEKNSINYFLIGGTLLGAVRHSGFIPWDDDLDIGMLRNDYNKFIECSKEQLGSAYFLQTWETDNSFAMPFAKIRKNGTTFVERNSGKTNQHKGIFIDIFPFDNAPDNEESRKHQARATYILKRILLSKTGYEVWEKNDYLKRVIYKIIRIVSNILNRNNLIKLLGNDMTKYNDKDTLLVTNIGGAYGYEKESVSRDWVSNLTEIRFENELFKCPLKYHEYLSHIYGDYMTLPPEDKRYDRHKIVEIKFSDDNFLE